jgi:hypothetical protein
MVARHQAGRRAGTLRWGEEERRLLQRTMELNQREPNNPEAFDPHRAGEVAYLRIHYNRHELFSRHPAKNFYQNARRGAREWLSDQALRGGRPCELFLVLACFLVFRN